MSTALLVMWMWAAQGHITVKSWTLPANECKSFPCWIEYKNVRIYLTSNPADPVDVPAVQEIDATDLCWAVPSEDNVQICGGTHVRWTCSDKSRVLLTSEDGAKHCIKFGGR